MLETCVVSNDEVYEICNNHFTNIGLPLKPAKGTPLKLSYLWKHVVKLTDKFIEWEFTLDEIDAYMKIVAHRLNQFPPRQRTLQNAIKADMLEYCYKELKRQSTDQDDLITKISLMKDWLVDTAGPDPESQVSHLTKRHKQGALPNLIVYYQQGRLNKAFIAFSAVCREALRIIGTRNPVERSFCPNDAALHFTTHYKLKDQATQIRTLLEL